MSAKDCVIKVLSSAVAKDSMKVECCSIIQHWFGGNPSACSMTPFQALERCIMIIGSSERPIGHLFNIDSANVIVV